jgi:hypothetical protein
LRDLAGHGVAGLDNLSMGSLHNLERHRGSPIRVYLGDFEKRAG